MARCFITGIELTLGNAYVLDLTAAHRALKELRQKAASLERLIQQLGGRDDTEVFDRSKSKLIIRKDRRLVSRSVAEALSAACPQERLFITWTEWHSRRPNINGAPADKVGEISPETGEKDNDDNAHS